MIDPVRIGGVVARRRPTRSSASRFPARICTTTCSSRWRLLIIFVCMRLEDSRIGRAWVAIREDEIAAQAMGINTRNVKLLAFAMGASFGGVAGGLFSAFQGFVSPESFALHGIDHGAVHGRARRHGPRGRRGAGRAAARHAAGSAAPHRRAGAAATVRQGDPRSGKPAHAAVRARADTGHAAAPGRPVAVADPPARAGAARAPAPPSPDRVAACRCSKRARSASPLAACRRSPRFRWPSSRARSTA